MSTGLPSPIAVFTEGSHFAVLGVGRGRLCPTRFLWPHHHHYSVNRSGTQQVYWVIGSLLADTVNCVICE